MSPPKDEGPVAGAPGEALDSSLNQHAAPGPSANTHDKQVAKQAQGVKPCTTCGSGFTPNRSRFRKCLSCSRAFKRAQIDLVKQRSADGVTAFELRERLYLLRSDDAATTAWLNTLRAEAKS